MDISKDQLKNEMMYWLRYSPKDYSEMKFKEIFELVSHRGHEGEDISNRFYESFRNPIANILDEVK